LYQHAFNPRRPAEPGSAAAHVLDWAQQASLPVGCLSMPAVLRSALEALTFRLDGRRAPPTPSSASAPSCTARHSREADCVPLTTSLASTGWGPRSLHGL
jgi:hypothetical protein